MLHSVQFSVIRHLDTILPELNDVVWMYNGVKLTGRKAPFATVENIYVGIRVLDKLYQYESDLLSFQVGVYSLTNGDNAKLADKVKKALLQPVEYFDTDLNMVTGTFRVNVNGIQWFDPNGSEDETGMHRRHLDITVNRIEKI